MTQKQKKKFCDCGFRIRGEHHTDGPHHRRVREVVTGARLSRIEQARAAKGRKTNVPPKGR